MGTKTKIQFENKKHNNDQWLDSITLKSYYENVLGMPPEVTSFYDPIMASIIGFGCDALSAYWGKYFEMPGFLKTSQIKAPFLQSFPGGNTGIARHFIKKLINKYTLYFCLEYLDYSSNLFLISSSLFAFATIFFCSLFNSFIGTLDIFKFLLLSKLTKQLN